LLKLFLDCTLIFKYLFYFYLINFLQMKKLYILFFLTIGFFGNAQIVNIPNANFKAKLLSATPSIQIASIQTPDSFGNVTSYNKIDINNDGEIQVSEAQAIKWLKINYSAISNLVGIEEFINLITLNCSNNQITSLNLSSLINLQYFDCKDNQLSTLDIIPLVNLRSLNCSNNQLTNLNVSSLLNLKSLNCYNNQLPSLDISSLTNLEVLSCGINQLTNLDASNLINLQQLRCDSNQLTSLNVSGLSNLQYLDCGSNRLISIDVSNLINLETLVCGSNQLTSLNVSNLSNLKGLTCSVNQLSSLDVSGLLNLQGLFCNDNQLLSIDVTDLIYLDQLSCSNNQITNLDVSSSTNLFYLDCNNNLLTNLNLKNNNSIWGDLDIEIPNGGALHFSDNPNLLYICADEEDVSMVQQKINDYGYTNCHVNSYCLFTPGGIFYQISGNTKFDLNSNGCDVSDINYSNLRFNITNGTVPGSMISNQTGNYYIPVQAGNHTITPNLEIPAYFNISPTNFIVNFPTQASPFNQDFCVTANGVKLDVEIILLPTTPARPGFDSTYKLVYRNKGNQVENGTVSLTFDDARLDFVSSNPVYNNSSLNNFTWNYSSLQPFETREILIVFNVNSPMETPAVNNGDVLNYTATITTANTDQTPTDNTFTLDQTVVGSYDPNDKTCLEGVTITPSEVGKYVHYVIRFENTGTYPAENIVVKDMIDLNKFDIATLVPLKSSHDFYTRISGNKVEFIFENINLDFNDATNDGYVVFKIKTKPTLVIGNTFTNNANIYFDYNFPITTNTYSTTVAALSTQDFEFGTYFTLYPNPTKDVLNIQSKQNLAINSVEIYNQLG